jgi:hypothetical protein
MSTSGPWTSAHVDSWLVNTGRPLTTKDGKAVEVYEFQHQPVDAVLSAWAKHFRHHYCGDDEIDALRSGTGLSKEDYLKNLVFPDSTGKPGPSVRAGDFAEILLTDYLEYVLRHWTPRFRYDSKASRNESTRGADIIGFQFVGAGESPGDTLTLFEVKARLSGPMPRNRLQEAADDSAKDFRVRKAEILNALKRRCLRDGRHDEAARVERFQDKADRPYHEVSGAAAVLTTTAYDPATLAGTDASKHPNAANLALVVIKGDDLMRLVHDLYGRAAREA